MNPIEAYNLIRAACLRRPELKWKKPPSKEIIERLQESMAEDYIGFCYIASHAFSQLTGAEVWATKEPMHYWNVLEDQIWDLTKEQFTYDYPYEDGYRVPRKNKNKLPARVKELLNECKC